MRLLLSALIILCSFSCFAQSNLQGQIYAIIKDSANDFMSFKREFKERSGGDSIYHTSMTIEGTNSNWVSKDSLGATFTASIAKSEKKKEVEKLFAEWKKKIQHSLPEYKAFRMPLSMPRFTFHGWIYKIDEHVEVQLFSYTITTGDSSPESFLYLSVRKTYSSVK
jgi:hypothetical protein